MVEYKLERKNNMKLVLRIFNFILIGIAAVAMAFIAFTPLMQMNLNYTVETDTICNVFKGKLGEDGDNISESELRDIIVDKTGGDGIKFSLTLKLESKGMKKMRDASNDERIDALYDEVFKPVIDQVVGNEEIKGVISGIAEAMAKKMAKKAIKDNLFNHITGDDHQTDEFLAGAGIDDTYIDSKVDDLFEALTAENASVDTVTDEIVDIIKDLNGKIAGAEGSEYDEWRATSEKSDEDIDGMRTEIKETLQEALETGNLVDDDGKILSVDEALALIIEKAMNGESLSSLGGSSGEGEGEGSESLVLPKYAESSETSLSEEEQKTEETKKSLSEVVSEAAWKMIEENIMKDESTKNTIGDILGMVSKYGMIVQYVFLGMWGILAVFAILKSISRKKPYVYMGFFWWFALILFGIIELVFGALLFIKPILTVLKGTITLPEALMGLDFSIYSNLSVCWICNTVLFFFSIAYAVIGHKVKKQYKADKRAKKAAQAA